MATVRKSARSKSTSPSITEKNFIQWIGPRQYRPQRSSHCPAGFDLSCPEDVEIRAGEAAQIDLRIQLKMPRHLFAQLIIRSSYALTLTVLGGIIDPDFRGPIFLLLRNESPHQTFLSRGEKPAQIVFHFRPRIHFQPVLEFEPEETDRPYPRPRHTPDQTTPEPPIPPQITSTPSGEVAPAADSPSSGPRQWPYSAMDVEAQRFVQRLVRHHQAQLWRDFGPQGDVLAPSAATDSPDWPPRPTLRPRTPLGAVPPLAPRRAAVTRQIREDQELEITPGTTPRLRHLNPVERVQAALDRLQGDGKHHQEAEDPEQQPEEDLDEVEGESEESPPETYGGAKSGGCGPLD